MSEHNNNDWKEEIIVASGELVDKVKQLITDGNVRRVIIRKPNGESLIEVPLTAGVAVSGVLTLMAPVLAAIGAMTALVKDFKVEIVRTDIKGSGKDESETEDSNTGDSN